MADAIASNLSTYYKVLPLGDAQYEVGRYSDFLSSYDRSWGQFNTKVAPVMGNHEQSGDGYFDYFNGRGAATGVAGQRGKGWYAMTTGASASEGWQILALNSECPSLGCEAEQLTWLNAQLAASEKPCTLAYWHRPRFSSGAHGDDASVAPLWQAIADHGGEVVISGHEHNYERMGRRGANGGADAAGVRQFIVGTGGKEFRPMGSSVHTRASNVDTFGYLEMTLKSNSYDWRFVAADAPGNGRFEDSGSASCQR